LSDYAVKVGASRSVGGIVGRASNRKKAQRQAGQKPQADAATQQALLTLATGLQAMVDENEKRDEGVAAASRAW
jgi:hypothetical protein